MKNKCTNNPLWDNTRAEGNRACIEPTDCRHEFCVGLRNFWSKHPMHLKGKTTGRILHNGLFGTGLGITIMPGAFPVYKKYSVKELVEDYCATYGIPAVVKAQWTYKGERVYVFASEASAKSEEYLWRR